MSELRNPTGPSGRYTYEIFETLFKYEIAREQRYPSALALLLIGLEVGGQHADEKDQASQVMADLLNKSLRISDVPAYYNDEYLVLLPATDEHGAQAVAERILSRFRSTQPFPTGGLFKMELFIGIASQHGDKPISADQLMAEASVAMNEARVKKSRKYISFSEIAPHLPRTK